MEPRVGTGTARRGLSGTVIAAIVAAVLCLLAAAPAFAHFVTVSINAVGGYVIVHPEVSTTTWTFAAISGSRHPYLARSVTSGGVVNATAGPFGDNNFHVMFPPSAVQRCSIDNQAASGTGSYKCSD